MKYLLTLAAGICIFFNAQSQELTNNLLGTWQIQKFQYSDHPNNNEKYTGFIKYKSYTPTHFIVTEISKENGTTTTSIFGTYKFQDSVYSETIISVNKESAFMMGKTFSFKLKFDGKDKIALIGGFNNMKTAEYWERAVTNNALSQPLYVIKAGGKSMQFQAPITSENSPLKVIPQESIASIEVLKDETALKLYGEAGRKGVIIVSILETEYANVLKKLKAEGVIN
ncbi:MAG: hypothetical protein V4687_00540 [Bacteroidota bacterium]